MTYSIELAQTTDRKLAALHGEVEKIEARLESAVEYIHHAAGDQRELWKGARRGPWGKSLDECRATTPRFSHQLESFARYCATVDACRAELATLAAAIAVENAVFEAHRWSRFFLVVSSDGHIHSSLGCSTCHRTTRYAWLPDLSGLDEAAAVAAHGAKLCTVCFASAPVEYTNFFDLERAASTAAECAGSRKYAGRANHCPVCGKYGRPSRNGYVRAHKAPTA